MNIKDKMHIFMLPSFVFSFSKLKFWNRFLVTIITIISLLIMFAIFSVNVLNYITNPIIATNNNVIVEIYPESTIEKTKQKTKIVTNLIEQNTLIKNYKIVEDDEIVKIFKTFSGNYKDNIYNIPLPTIINIEFINTNNLKEEIDNFRFNLSQKVKDVYVDSETELLNRLANPVQTSKHTFIAIPIIAFLLLVIIIVATLYAVMFSNKNTIKILLLLGLKHTSLAFEFALWVLLKSFIACLISFLFSCSILLFMAFNIDTLIIVNSILFFLALLIILPIISFILSVVCGIKIIKIVI